MPIVSVQLLAGRTQEIKDKIANEITDSIAKHASVDKNHIYVLFNDVEPQDWAVGGTFFAARNTAK